MDRRGALPIALTLAFVASAAVSGVAALLGACSQSTSNPVPPVMTDPTLPQPGCVDHAGSCPGGALGYSCTGGAQPSHDPTACSPVGPPASDGTTTYCCEPPHCSADPTGQACVDAGSGAAFLCSGGAVPPANSSTTCSALTPNTDGTVPYCCIDFGSFGCQPGGGLACPANTGVYTCVDAGNPTTANPSLGCSLGFANSDGGTEYCCGSGGCKALANDFLYGCMDASTPYECPGTTVPLSSATTTCAFFSTYNPPDSLYCCTPGPCTPMIVTTGCAQPGAMPFACAGAARPDDNNSSIVCNSIAGQIGQYCCFTASCGYVNAIHYCDVGQTAVLCSGKAMPAQLDPSLTRCIVSPYGDVPQSTVYCCN
jgi:hypothetical protein